MCLFISSHVSVSREGVKDLAQGYVSRSNYQSVRLKLMTFRTQSFHLSHSLAQCLCYVNDQTPSITKTVFAC